MSLFEQQEQFLDFILTSTPNPRQTVTPFLYVIKSKTLDTYYVGIRYSKKDSIPSLFWQNYKTSSEVVADCISRYGVDDFEILSIVEKDPLGRDWEFPTDESFELGEFERQAIKLLWDLGYTTLNKGIGLGKHASNPYKIMADGRPLYLHNAESSAKTRKETILETGETLAEAGSRKAAETKKSKLLDNGLTLMQDTVRRSGIRKFNRTIYLYKGDDFIGSYVLKSDLIKTIQNKKVVDEIVKLYDSGGGTLYIESNNYNKGKCSIWNGLEVLIFPKIKQHYHVDITGVECTVPIMMNSNPTRDVGNLTTKIRKETKLQNGLTIAENSALKLAINKFNRTIYLYKGDDFIGGFNTRKQLEQLFGSMVFAKHLIKQFDNGDRFLTYTITQPQTQQKFSNWIGLEMLSEPKCPSQTIINHVL